MNSELETFALIGWKRQFWKKWLVYSYCWLSLWPWTDSTFCKLFAILKNADFWETATFYFKLFSSMLIFLLNMLLLFLPLWNGFLEFLGIPSHNNSGSKNLEIPGNSPKFQVYSQQNLEFQLRAPMNFPEKL